QRMPFHRLASSISRLVCGRRPAAVAAGLVLVVAGCAVQPPQTRPVAASGVPASVALSSPVPAFSADLAGADDRRATFEYAWRLVHDRFYDPDFNGVDWDAARARYVEELDRVRSDASFYGLMSRMVGELRDSHTRIYTAREYRNRME